MEILGNGEIVGFKIVVSVHVSIVYFLSFFPHLAIIVVPGDVFLYFLEGFNSGLTGKSSVPLLFFSEFLLTSNVCCTSLYGQDF